MQRFWDICCHLGILRICALTGRSPGTFSASCRRGSRLLLRFLFRFCTFSFLLQDGSKLTLRLHGAIPLPHADNLPNLLALVDHSPHSPERLATLLSGKQQSGELLSEIPAAWLLLMLLALHHHPYSVWVGQWSAECESGLIPNAQGLRQ